MTNAAGSTALTDVLWSSLQAPGDAPAPPPPLELTGPPAGLPSVFAVDALACATVSAALAAVSELHAARTGALARRVRIDPAHVAAAFRSERLQEPIGWKLPEIWDPIAGDYRTRDGFIRIHTNYETHRDAALSVLQVPAQRDAVTSAVRERGGDELEAAIVAAGGAAAKLRTLTEWQEHPQGRAVAAEPLVAATLAPCPRPSAIDGTLTRPLVGIRVLDLTRVIAGPVCTRVLAAYGADVLRIDPPGFREVGALLGETTAGKRRASLDLKSPRGRAAFLQLARTADILICGYRNSVLERLELGPSVLRAANPSLATVRLDAYGWTGPWADRRGFDSLVQMSTGIADRARTRPDAAGALPAQALDHGSGYFMAAAACRALTRRLARGVTTDARLSLARLATLLLASGDAGDATAPLIASGDPYRERDESGFGPLLRVRVPGGITGVTAELMRPAGPLGSDPASWD